MEKTKLISIFKSLNRSEIEKFGLYLNTPLFNEREMVLRLFGEIRKFYPEFSSEAFTKESIFAKLYNGKPYNDDLMRNMISRLYRLLGKFLSLLYYERDTFGQQYGLLCELNNRGHDKLFKKEMETALKYVDSGKIDINYYFNSHRLAYLNRVYYDNFKQTHIIENDSLRERGEKLTEYFLADILHVYCLMINQSNIYPEKKYDMAMLKYLRGYLDAEGKPSEENYYLSIYYSMLMMLNTGEKKYYSTLRSLVNNHSSRLTEEDKSTFYTSMHNYIQESIFKGNRNAMKEKLELYRESFANRGEYFSNGKINHLNLIGAVNYSLVLKDINGSEAFLDMYIGDVEEYYKESTYFYCRALIEYYKGNYNNSLKLLNKVSYDDISFKIQVKTLQLMAYFSIHETEGFYSFVDSFRHFLVSNKLVSEYFRNLYLTFINFAFRLFKGMEDKDKFDIGKFKNDLNATNNIAKKHWLQEMTEKF